VSACPTASGIKELVSSSDNVQLLCKNTIPVLLLADNCSVAQMSGREMGGLRLKVIGGAGREVLLIQTACLFSQQQQPGIYNLGTDLCVNDAQRYRVTLFEVQIYEDYCGSCIGFMAPQVLSWRLWL
jgi:hypothetical protein